MNEIIIEKSMGDWNLEELVDLYMTTNNEDYFNLLWRLVKPFSIKIGNKYPSIAYEDKTSIAMEVLWDTCRNLKKGKKLLTLYGTCLANRYCDIYGKKMQTHKYKINAEASSLDQMYEDVNYQPSVEMDLFFIDDFYNQCQLRSYEIAIVNLLNQGYKSREIAKKLEMKIEDYERLFQNIKDKVLVNYFEESKGIRL